MGLYWMLLLVATFWPQSDSLQEHMMNVCEGQPDAEVVTQRLRARSSEAAAAGVTHVNVSMNVSYNGSSARSFDVKTTPLSDSSRITAMVKGRPARAVRFDTTNLCPWVYRIQKVNNHYLPTYIVQAELLAKPERPFVYTYNGRRTHCFCAAIISDLPVLSFSSCVNGTERWKQESHAVTVGFTCVDTI